MNKQIPISLCPRCRTKGVSVEVLSSHVYNRGNNAERFGICGVCNRGVILCMFRDTINDVLPKVDVTLPEHLPDNVSRFLEQGNDSISQKNWDAAGGMFRKTLEAALKNKFSKNAKDTLNEQIEKAAVAGGLTSDLADWADQIRFLGNDAIHDDNPFPCEDAKELANFTELVMIYLFTLPEMLKEAKKKREIKTTTPVPTIK